MEAFRDMGSPPLRYIPDAARRGSLSLGLGGTQEFGGFEKRAAVHDVIEAEGGVASAQVTQQLLERVGGIAGRDADGAEVAGVAQPVPEFRQRVAALERHAAGAMRAAEQVLDQQQLVK